MWSIIATYHDVAIYIPYIIMLKYKPRVLYKLLLETLRELGGGGGGKGLDWVQ